MARRTWNIATPPIWGDAAYYRGLMALFYCQGVKNDAKLRPLPAKRSTVAGRIRGYAVANIKPHSGDIVKLDATCYHHRPLRR